MARLAKDCFAPVDTYVDELIDGFLVNAIKETISISGTPLKSITQESYAVPNFYTKTNLLNHLLADKVTYGKVLIFVGTRVNADRLFETLNFESEMSIIHSGKEQNHRTRSIDKFADGRSRILIATDVISRGIDIEKITTVISFDTPFYPENYIHRIGRTGRAEQEGRTILLYGEKEIALKEAIESLMNYKIPLIPFPKDVEVTTQLTPEEKPKPDTEEESPHKDQSIKVGASFHKKSAKNSKERTEKKSYRKQLKERYKKPVRRGDKIQNMRKKNKRR